MDSKKVATFVTQVFWKKPLLQNADALLKTYEREVSSNDQFIEGLRAKVSEYEAMRAETLRLAAQIDLEGESEELTERFRMAVENVCQESQRMTAYYMDLAGRMAREDYLKLAIEASNRSLCDIGLGDRVSSIDQLRKLVSESSDGSVSVPTVKTEGLN